MEKSDRQKKIFNFLVVSHILEAAIAYRAAKKRGKGPVKYSILTLFLGVFILVPLLRSKPEEE